MDDSSEAASESAGVAFANQLRLCLIDLEDPRVVGRCDHLLFDIVAITLLAVMCGAEDWTDVEDFAEVREDWLRGFLELPGGVPSHDTFGRVIGLLEADQFAACLFEWTRALHEATGIRNETIAIDGKTLRRSKNRAGGMLHLVTAWASQNGLTLGQVAVAKKSGEAVAIPRLLELLSLKGTTVTLDAGGTQTAIAEQIRRQKGHYVLAVKGNQKTLKADMQALFDEASSVDFEGYRHAEHSEGSSGCLQRRHGRIEERCCHVLEVPKDHPQRSKWKDLRTLVVTISRREIKGVESYESRLFISSHPPPQKGRTAKMLATAIRRHWSIENSQHWVLDVAFDEDRRRQQDRNAAANLAAVRRLAVSLLHQEKTVKKGAKCKRMRCALEPGYLFTVLNAANFDA